MPAIAWDCWIGDESGSSRVDLKGTDQPKPIPLPEKQWRGSQHPLIKPGYTVDQSFGYSRKQLTVNLRCTYETWVLIEALMNRVDSGTGEHKAVQFSNSYNTFLCTPAGDHRPQLTTLAPVRVLVSLVLLIQSVVA